MRNEEPRENSARNDNHRQNTKGNTYRDDHRANGFVGVVSHCERGTKVQVYM